MSKTKKFGVRGLDQRGSAEGWDTVREDYSESGDTSGLLQQAQPTPNEKDVTR